MRTDKLELILYVVLKLLVAAGRLMTFVPNEIVPSVTVVKSTLVGSSWSFTTTCAAGNEADAWFSNATT